MAAKIVIVAAIGANNIIGRDGQLPWRLKSDLKHFRELTFGKPVIMGRKTYVSIGKPLPGRTNIVITRDPEFSAASVVTAPSLKVAVELAGADAERRGAGELMVIGGGDIFAAAMTIADRLEITHVDASPAGDVAFPAIDLKVWREVARKVHKAGSDDSAGFAVATYLRA
jgi:dihydrofolate reductase